MKVAQMLCIAAAGSIVTSCGDSGSDLGPEPELICTIPVEEIFAGAAGRDAIPSLTNPEIAGADAGFMRDDDRVLGMFVNGEARAYPFGIMWWHEIVNDTLGGTPILVTYCPLTGSGIAFDPMVQNELRNFGVSGLLWLTNLIMFDRTTNSLWNQMSLGAQCGPDRGLDLARMPVMETDWGNWKNVHPNTTVITPNTGFGNRPYFEYPYGNYDDPANQVVDFLPSDVTWSNERLPKELVLGVFDGADAVAYPLMALADSANVFIVNDDVGSIPVLVTAIEQWNTAEAFDRRVNGQELTFTLTNPGPLTMTDTETGSEWNVSGEAVSGPLTGERLAPLADAFVAFWFAWSIYFPNTEVFE